MAYYLRDDLNKFLEQPDKWAAERWLEAWIGVDQGCGGFGDRQAFGYRNREFFELKLFALHNAKYALIG